MTNKNTNVNDNADNNKINISINLAQPEIKKKKKYKKRKARLSAEDKNKILGGSSGNFATQIPVNYLSKYSDRSLGGGNYFSPQPDNNQRLPLALPYQLPQALNGGIQYIQQIPQQIQAPPSQQIQAPPSQQIQQPQMLNIDGVSADRVLYDPVNRQLMRPDGDRIQVLDDVSAVPSRPTSSIPRPNKPPPPLPDLPQPRAFPPPARPPPPYQPPPPPPINDDDFQDAFDTSSLPPTKPIPPIPKRKSRRLPAYIDKTGDNIQIENTDYYVSKRDGLKLDSELYQRTGRGRTANKLKGIRMTYGEYLDRMRTRTLQEEPPKEFAMQEPPREFAMQEPQRMPIGEAVERTIIQEAEDEIDRQVASEVSRLLGESPRFSENLDVIDREIIRLTGNFPPLPPIPRPPLSRPPSIPRPPSTPKPFPPRPPSPSISPSLITPEIKPDTPTSVSADVVFIPDTPENLNFILKQYTNITPEQFDRLTTNLRKNRIPFDVPPQLRGKVRLMPNPIDISSDLAPEDRPDTSDKKNRGLIKRMNDILSKFTSLPKKTSKISPDISPEITPDITPVAKEGEYPQEQMSFIEQQASQMRAKTKDLLDETTQNIVISTMELPPIVPEEIPEEVPEIVPEIVPEEVPEIVPEEEEDIDTIVLENERMIRQAERMRTITNRLFDETTQRKLTPPSSEIKPDEDEKIKKNFEEKYYEPQRRRPSSAKNTLDEALYQNKMDEIRSELEQFDREYNFNYQNYLEGQRITTEDKKKMTDILLKKYGLNHKAADLYIKEFLDTFNETERKEILTDYEERIKENVDFYIGKINRGKNLIRNLKSRLLSANLTDDQKKEIFFEAIKDTNLLTSTFKMFLNEDFRELLFQEYSKINDISLDNPRTFVEIITPVRYPYGARRKLVYRKPTPKNSPEASPSSTASSVEKNLKFPEPSITLPSVVEETPTSTPTPPPQPQPPPRRLAPVRTRTRKELEQMQAIASRQPIPPPPPPPRTSSKKKK